MRSLCILVIALLVSFITGCVTPGKGVRVHQQNKDTKQWYTGNAAIIGTNRIVTANHVVDLHDELTVNVHRFSWKRKFRIFKVKEKFLSTYEPYVFLECDDVQFRSSYVFNIGSGAPYEAITHRGTFKWKDYRPKPGDSGSPVVNKSGELIGVVYGYTNPNRRPLYIPIKND